MTCVYEYKGHKFNSELELDDFLLTNGHDLYSKYGDMVFELDLALRITELKILSLEPKGLELLKKKFKLQSSEYVYMDTENEDVEEPYVAITKFLAGCVNPVTMKLLFPEFRPEFTNEEGLLDGYFPKRYNDWKQGSFTDVEFRDFFNNDPTKVHKLTEEECKEFRKFVLQKWQNQGKIGTEIHKVLYNVFKTVKTKEGKDLHFYDLTEEKLFEYIEKEINKDYLNDDNIKEIIKYGKALHRHLRKEFGDNATYHPEYIVWGDYVDENGKLKQALGKIDLLVNDEKGITHIIDYKTSPEDYSILPDTKGGYSSAKIQAFKYQLGTYSLLSRMLGFGNSATLVYVAPMLLLNFRKQNDKWIFDNIKSYSGFLDNLSTDIVENAKIESVLRLYFRNLGILDDKLENLLTDLNKNMSSLFNTVERVDGKYSEEDITAIINRRAKLKKGSEEVEYRKASGQVLVFENMKVLRDWLKKYLETKHIEISSFTERLADVIDNISEGDDPSLYTATMPVFEFEDGSTKWINETLKKYYTGNYFIIKNDSAKKLQELGIILVKNKYTNNIDVITISDKVLFGYNILARGRKKITAKFSDDATEEANSEQIFESINGNIEMIKTMLLLNAIPDTLRGSRVNEMRVINPILGSGSWASNELILFNYKRLLELSFEKGNALPKNNIIDGAIMFSDSYLQFVNEYLTIIFNHLNSHDRRWKQVANCTVDFDAEVTGFDNRITTLAELNKLKESMEKYFPLLKNTPKNWDTTSDAEMLYFRLSLAISHLNNADYIQQFADSDKMLDSINIFKSGITGTRLDNPGMLKNKNLNKTVKLTTEGYLNLRRELLNLKAKLRTAIAELKKELNFGYFSGRLYKNKVDLFKPLFNEAFLEQGELVLKNPDDPSLSRDLTEALKNVLRIALEVFNKNRHSDKTLEYILSMKNNNSIAYYRLPLTPGKMNSTISQEGLLNAIRSRIKFLLPEKAKQDFVNRESGFDVLKGDRGEDDAENISNLETNASDENLRKTVDIPKHSIHRFNIWQMTTMFDAGETEMGRERLLKQNGLGYFELDLETLILKHEFAYRLKDIMDRVLPLIKAGVLNILYQQLMQGHDYTEDINYIEDYVKNKIFNKSLVEDKYKAILAYKSGIMRAASVLALGFNPRLFYQNIEGIFKDIKLIISKPDGSYLFTSKELLKAFKEVSKEAFHYGDTRSKLELINEFFALNDMDMHPDVYVEKIIDDKSIIYNFQNVLFRFTSRPDFYNRLTIFVAHMMHDGCYDAYSVKDNKLIYDWKLDTRFDKVAKLLESGETVESIAEMAKRGGKENDKLAKQLGLYYRYILQMALEGVKIVDKDGNVRLIRKGDALPLAYPTILSEAYKSVSDKLYGYYAHEKKALFQSTLVGSMILQMYTYWSGKKNLYFESSGVKINGQFEAAKDKNGADLFLDANGRQTTTNTGIRYILWKGRFLEGILLTLEHMRELIHLGILDYDRGIIKGLPKGIDYMRTKMFRGVPPELKEAYVHNLIALSYDLAIWLAVGLLLFRPLFDNAKLYVKENDADTFAQAITNDGIMLGANLMKSSVMDFNMFESIGGRGIDWTPFSISMMHNTYKNAKSFLTGKQSFAKTLEKSTSASRQLHQVMDYLWTDHEKEKEERLEKRIEKETEKMYK